MSYQEVVRAAEDFLQEHKGGPKSSREIAAFIEQQMAEGKIETHPRNVIYSYLSRAANHDEISKLNSGGPYGGYFIDFKGENEYRAPARVDQNEKENEIQDTQFKNLEKHLYPLVTAWLEASEYVSADVSSLRSGGLWGNPDILGISRMEILGVSEIEIVSVEVKLSDDNWERYIFEAISHKRFANRSWYCYRTTTPYPPLPKNMAYYAERYKVGIIQIYLTNEEMEKIANNPADSIAYLDRIQERVRALYEAVPLQEKRSFLTRAGMGLNIQVVREK